MPPDLPAEPVDALTGADALSWVRRYCELVTRRADELTELDRLVGDGDFGWNVSAALSRARSTLDGSCGQRPGEVFRAVSGGFLGAGGTSGPLFGLWFGELARPQTATLSLATLAAAVQDGTDAVMRIGNAEVGHKTMVDAMMPATAALRSGLPDGDLAETLAAAAAAALRGAESTRSMVAGRGRAAYVGEHARGVIDPGALAVAWFFAAAVEGTGR